MRGGGQIRTGQTIAEKRERLETASERLEARKKSKKQKTWRVFLVTSLFLAMIVALISLIMTVLNGSKEELVAVVEVPYKPTVEVIDEDAAATGGVLSGRMSEYIGQAESDFRDLGYQPIKVVIPTGKMREVDFYLEDYSGAIKMTIDRETGVSVEDADRMIKYLDGGEFEYIDVRVEGKGYWK